MDREIVTDYGNLYYAYRKAKSGKKFNSSTARFSNVALDGINILKEQLENQTYTVAPYNRFEIYEPKQRVIESCSFKDKVVQHILCDNILHPKLKNVFIKYNSAGQIGKGTLYALDGLRDHMESFYAVYDVPGKTSDGEMLEDASEEVYDFILCCICPVKLSKAGLTYNGKDERMEERTRDWVVDMPDKGFLFPAFNDRQTDVHSVLYYTRKSAEVQEEMVRELLGIDLVVSADEEKDKFGKLLRDVFGEDADCKIVKDIYEGISEEMERHAEDPEPYKIDRNELKRYSVTAVYRMKRWKCSRVLTGRTSGMCLLWQVTFATTRWLISRFQRGR